jgi:hypothetical protein
MIKRWLLTFFMMAMGIVLLAIGEWLETKSLEIDQITKGYKDDLREIRSIDETSRWLENVAIPYFSSTPMTRSEVEVDMIRFYDRYANLYQFNIVKFVYYDTAAKMEIGFSFSPKNKDDIARFLALRYDQGLIQIQKAEMSKGKMNGILTLIQPLSGETNASR